MGLENLKSAYSNIQNNSQIGGRHGGTSGETPSLPPHPEWHSILDDINPYTNQFVYNYQYKNPNKGGVHGANIDFNGTPVLSTPFYEIENMTEAFGMIGGPVNFLSRLQGTNSYFPPVGRIPGFVKNNDKGGYSYADGQVGNSKYIGISSNVSFDTPDIFENFQSTFVDLPNFGRGMSLGTPQITPFANDIFQLNQYSSDTWTSGPDIVLDFNPLPENTKLYNNNAYDPRIESMYFGRIVPINNVNSYNGSKFDDNVGGLFNLVSNTSDDSKKYSTVFRTINIPSGFVDTDSNGNVMSTPWTGGDVFRNGNITTGEGYPNLLTAYQKFINTSLMNEPVRYSDNPSSFILNTPEPNVTNTNDFVQDRILTTTQMGTENYNFSTFYNSDHTPKDNKRGPGDVKSKLSLKNNTHNSGYRGTEPYIVSNVGTDETENSSRYWQWSRSIIDEKRIFEFMKSEAGLWFMGKQNLLGLNTRVIVEDDVESMVTNNVPGSPTDERRWHRASGQRFKRWYSPLSTMASAFRLGGGGFPNILVDREFPFGEVAGLLGADTDYSKFIKNRKRVSPGGGLINIGGLPSTGRAAHDRNFDITDESFSQDDYSAPTGVIADLASAIPGVQVKPKGPKLGDFMTLNPYKTDKVYQSNNFAGSYGGNNTLSLVKNNNLQEMEKEKHGLPFYFRDLRTNAYLIFRAYITGLTENIQPSWTSENYIGRSEPVYIYDKTERDISFTLTLFAQNINELKAIYRKMNVLTSLCYPEYKSDINFQQQTVGGQTLNLGSMGKNRMKPPFTMMRVGELYGSVNHELMGFVKSLTYSFPDNSPWETKRGRRVPKLITAQLNYQVVHASVPGVKFDESLKEFTSTAFVGWPGTDSNDMTPSELKNKIQPDVVVRSS